MPHIPQEIIDAILDHLAGCHESSVVWRTCALASKSLQQYSQKLLFRSITIDTERPSLSRLHAVLEDNPHLGRHVRELVLFIESGSSSLIFDTLLNTLIMLTGVTTCTWVERWPLSPTWPTQENLRTKLYQFLRMPSIAKLVIHGADPVLVRFLTSCEQLESLAVNIPPDVLQDSLILPGASISMMRSTLPSGPLEALFIHQKYIVALVHSLTSQSSRLRVTRLRKLALMGSFENFEEERRKASQQVLDLCADSLEELAFGKHLLSGPFSVARTTPTS